MAGGEGITACPVPRFSNTATARLIWTLGLQRDGFFVGRFGVVTHTYGRHGARTKKERLQVQPLSTASARTSTFAIDLSAGVRRYADISKCCEYLDRIRNNVVRHENALVGALATIGHRTRERRD
jgi:hypothetical protein